MEHVEKKELTLYLTSWQRRMLKDFMQSGESERHAWLDVYGNLTKARFAFPSKIDLVTYRVPNFDQMSKGMMNLYLTDEQIIQISDLLGVKEEFSALQISFEMIEEKVIAFEK